MTAETKVIVPAERVRGRGVDVAGHRLHQMLVVFPLGLLAGAATFDVIHLIKDRQPIWAEISFWLIAAGVITALIAAVFGFADWIGIPRGTRAKKVGAVHGIGNVIVVALFGFSWLLRRDVPFGPSGFEMVLSFSGVALAVITGWLGGELVARMGIGVDVDANPNAPSSLAGRRRARREPVARISEPTMTGPGHV